MRRLRALLWCRSGDRSGRVVGKSSVGEDAAALLSSLIAAQVSRECRAIRDSAQEVLTERESMLKAGGARYPIGLATRFGGLLRSKRPQRHLVMRRCSEQAQPRHMGVGKCVRCAAKKVWEAEASDFARSYRQRADTRKQSLGVTNADNAAI
jgi:hypothetical protein